MAAPAAGAATFSVTGTADGTPACTAGSCPTLRSAIAAAKAAGGTNTITLPAGTFTLTGGELKIEDGVNDGDSLTIQGAGAGQTIIDGNGSSRIFELTGDPSNLSLSGVTLQHGQPAGEGSTAGGAILDSGWGDHITIDKSTLTQNSATGSGAGGAISALSENVTLTVTDSTISHNSTAKGPGGGIAASNLQMSGSTVDHNSTGGDSGGGIYLDPPFCFCETSPVRAAGLTQDRPPNPSIVNSTIVANSTGDGEGTGGGVMVDVGRWRPAPVRSAAHKAQRQAPTFPGLVSLISDTIVGNTSISEGGANVDEGSVYFNENSRFSTPVWIQGTIIGGGTTDGTPSNCYLTNSAIDGGSNLVFSTATSGDRCFPWPAANDILPGDPKLASGPGLDTDSSGNFLLGDNGGPTQTIALLPGSPAIDAVTDYLSSEASVRAHAAGAVQAACTDLLGMPLGVDQRGALRPDLAATSCDIGAFESGAAPLVLTGSVTPNPGTVGQPLNYAFTVTNNGPSFGTQTEFDATLPPGATFDSATPSQGSCTTPTPTTVDCSLGVIPDGTANVTISLTPNSTGTYPVTGTASDRESGASAPLTLTATVGTTATVASSPKPKPGIVVKACVSRRHFPIHVQNLRRLHIASATIYVNGLAVATVHGKHLTAPLDLRQLPKGTFTITIVAHQRNGHVLRGNRTYHTCSVKLAGHKHLYL